jgi:RHS repeat-associated protein
VRQLTNSTGGVTDSDEYDAFGNKWTVSGSTPNNYLYRGEQWDPDLGLYYLRARYYNPLSGRFTGVDPLTVQGQKRYEYSAADPVDGSDPTGALVLETYWPLAPGKFSSNLQMPSPFGFCGGISYPAGINNILLPLCGTLPPHRCKKCFNTQAFAANLDSNTAGNTYKTTGRPGANDNSHHCAWYVVTALNAGGAGITMPKHAYEVGPELLSADFEAIAYVPYPNWYMTVAGSEVGDITVFDKTSEHRDGHVEGYTGAGPSGWVSYWKQEHWYVYGLNASPSGPATVYRSKCPCGQQ